VRTLTRTLSLRDRLVTSSSVQHHGPDSQREVQEMLDAARRAGFDVQRDHDLRSPEQEALLMANGRGRTHTLTSLHSYGRAIDVRIGNGISQPFADGVGFFAFRRWVPISRRRFSHTRYT